MASRAFVAQHGMNSQSPAVQHLIRTSVGNSVTGSKPRKRKKGPATSHYIKGHRTKKGVNVRGHYAKQGKNKRTGRVGKHFKKGSLAAKRYMSKLRKMRKAKSG